MKDNADPRSGGGRRRVRVMVTTSKRSAFARTWTDDLPTRGSLKDARGRELPKDSQALIEALTSLPGCVTPIAVTRRHRPAIPPRTCALPAARLPSASNRTGPLAAGRLLAAGEKTVRGLPTAVDRVQDPQEAWEYQGGASSDPQAHLSTASTA
jgi:hypothetical protein